MTEKLKILILIRAFNKSLPKHQPKFDTIKAIEKYADVRYWHTNGDIHEIIKKLNFTPDFILHYDHAWGSSLAPVISGLGTINIPKGSIVIDIHYNPTDRRNFFTKNKIDLIFSVTKSPFLKTFPQYQEQFRWFPFAINPEVFKDWNSKKDINFLLMGQVFDRERKSNNKTNTPRGKYPFREEVLVKMRGTEGFLFHQHPGHRAKQSAKAYLNQKYAKELNRAKIFFTCGSKYNYPVLKYFEAPACRTLLLAKPVPDLVELGFVDGENFVACNEDNVYETAMYYLENEAERTRIMDNGYHFIHTHHTNDVRAQQFVKYVEDYLAEQGKD
ncbi:glycosyltransferase [Neobacillus sp. PS2-9]|uniref:glycosyltransferase n=1 Tax=Neobacillus sp. PS2-9 TaxID=3070676 RepID=UPI0027E16B5A|nr:glycosyltransferase [Neobacillus sp. PS2-9]WML58020.1 glycosyltransferase [Neobacillus sp. PS2-9]